MPTSSAQHSQSRAIRTCQVSDELGGDLFLIGKYRECFQAYRESLDLVPNAPKTLENMAARLASCPDLQVGDPQEVLHLATRAVELSPHDRDIWRVLGLAHYRAGHWQPAAGAIEKSMELGAGNPYDWLPLAMAKSRLGNKNQARTSFDKAVSWIERNNSKDENLARFRAEAAALLGLTDQPAAAARKEENVKQRSKP